MRKVLILAILYVLIIGLFLLAGATKVDEKRAEHHATSRAALEPKVAPEPPPEPAPLNVTSTAYIALCDSGCTGRTATGLDVRNTTHYEGYRVIATDPDVIPLGTVVELTFEDGATEKAIAMDTGGAINGHRIDYLVRSYERAVQFGRQAVEVRILEGES